MSSTLLSAGVAPARAFHPRSHCLLKSETQLVSHITSHGGQTGSRRPPRMAVRGNLRPGYLGARLVLPSPKSQLTVRHKHKGIQASSQMTDDVISYFGKHSVLPCLPRVGLATAISVGVCTLCDAGIFPGINQLGHTVLGTLVSFLLVFRCQLAYSRYWEGGTQLVEAINCINNISIRVHTVVQRGDEGRQQRRELARTLRLYFSVVVESLRVGTYDLGRQQILADVVYADATPEEQHAAGSAAGRSVQASGPCASWRSCSRWHTSGWWTSPKSWRTRLGWT
eukprot:jgi/Mesvir1/3583/Mv12046-RA.2